MESTDSTDGTSASYRIAPELRTEQVAGTGSAHDLNERGGFAFVDRVEPGDNGDLVEVTFALPFGGQTFTQAFERPNSDADYHVPPVADLFEAAGVAPGDFEALVTRSVPVESADGYSVADLGEIDDLGPEEARMVDWLPEHVKLYPDPEISREQRWKRRLLQAGVLLAGGAVFHFGMLAGAVALLVTLVVVLGLQPDAFEVPRGARELNSVGNLEAGDVVLLDDVPLMDPQDRDVARVVDTGTAELVVELPSGLHANLRKARSDWYLEGAVSETKYENAYVLPV